MTSTSVIGSGFMVQTTTMHVRGYEVIPELCPQGSTHDPPRTRVGQMGHSSSCLMGWRLTRLMCDVIPGLRDRLTGCAHDVGLEGGRGCRDVSHSGQGLPDTARHATFRFHGSAAVRHGPDASTRCWMRTAQGAGNLLPCSSMMDRFVHDVSLGVPDAATPLPPSRDGRTPRASTARRPRRTEQLPTYVDQYMTDNSHGMA